MQASQETTITQTVYTSRKNLLSLLERQGYDCTDFMNFSINEVSAMLKAGQLDIYLTNKESGKKIYVKYYIEKQIKPNIIYDSCSDLFEYEEILNSNDEFMIIINGGINATIKDKLELIWNQDHRFVNIINIASLKYNILDHALVPEHIILSEKEKIVFRKNFHITDNNQIPEISRFDPVACAIGMRPGDICRIIRPSVTSIKTNSYRVCI
tara:strand:- start:807 stop:1439 length:633 start_codon:yes stop_codon:yes gene_type:complete